MQNETNENSNKKPSQSEFNQSAATTAAGVTNFGSTVR
jgi:preprotein translocase subunit Sss1